MKTATGGQFVKLSLESDYLTHTTGEIKASLSGPRKLIHLLRLYPRGLMAMLCAIILVCAAIVLGKRFIAQKANDAQAHAPVIASFFTSEVQYWSPQIVKWSQEYNLDPNLIATLIQIESCGLSNAVSSSGAQGLFQVMPMHFAPGEDMIEPENNARHGLKVFQECMNWASGNTGLALACYNGGPGLISKPSSWWPAESQRYFNWAMGIYGDSLIRAKTSNTLEQWLAYGGSHLCERAALTLAKPQISNPPG